MMITECRRCVNSTANPTIELNNKVLCNVCTLYDSKFKKSEIETELEFFKSMKNEKVMVGISGGKDSTATLYLTLKMGFKPFLETWKNLPKHKV